MLILSVLAPGVRPATAPASLTGRSAETNANAALLAIRFSFVVVAVIVAPTVPEAPLNVIAAPLAGRAFTVWSGESGSAIIDGEVVSVAVLEPETSAVMT